MKRLIWSFLLVVLPAGISGAAQPAPLTSLRAIQALSNAEADKGLPVVFEATVTYYHKGGYTLFMQDGGVGSYVSPPKNADLVPGDRVLVRGKTAAASTLLFTATASSCFVTDHCPKQCRPLSMS